MRKSMYIYVYFLNKKFKKFYNEIIHCCLQSSIALTIQKKFKFDRVIPFTASTLTGSLNLLHPIHAVYNSLYMMFLFVRLFLPYQMLS